MTKTMELEMNNSYHTIELDANRYEKLCNLLDNYEKPKRKLWKRLLINKFTIGALIFISLISVVTIINLLINIPILLEMCIYVFIIVPLVIYIMYLLADDTLSKRKARKYF